MDIRVDTKFFQHPKTLKLLRRLGPAGVIGLWRLWVWAAENRQTGYLHGLGPDDVDLIAWPDLDQTGPAGRPADQGGPVSFCAVAKELGWLDQTEDGGLCLHEWSQHNPWAADAPSRSDKARFSKLASVAPAAYLEMVKEGRTSITAEEYKAVVEGMSTTRQRRDNESTTTSNDRPTESGGRSAPSPSLSPALAPSPSRDIKEGQEPPPVDTVDKLRPLIIFYRGFPGYHAEGATKEREWLQSVLSRFPELDVLEELRKAREWVKLQNVQVKNSKAYINRWLERVQKERS